MRAARYAAQAARLGIQAAQAQIVFDTTVAYFDLLRSDEAVTGTRKEVAAAEQLRLDRGGVAAQRTRGRQ